jgi:hypothetical protein
MLLEEGEEGDLLPRRQLKGLIEDQAGFGKCREWLEVVKGKEIRIPHLHGLNLVRV